MKKLATLALMTWAMATQAAPICSNETVTFTKLEGGYAQLKIKKEQQIEISIYKMEFRPTRLRIWDLEKLDGNGPQTLAWQEEYDFYHVGCPRCAIFERRIKKIGTLTDNLNTLCETEL